MPFGIKGAPKTFQTLMSQEVLTGYLNVFCIVYLDDIIVYSRSWEQHLRHLALVLKRLSLHDLTAALEKCRFGRTQLEYLGHTVSAEGNEAKNEKVGAILDIAPPTTKRQLQAFIGSCNWLREYIPQLATTLAPLTDLLRGTRSFRWTKAAQDTFEATKDALRKPLKLSRPIPGAR